MRVLCVTGSSDRPEAETFIGLKKKGVDVRVLCAPAAPHRERMVQAGIPLRHVAPKRRIDSGAIRRIRRWIVEEKPDILHLFNNRAVSNGILAARGLPVRIVAYRGIVANVSFFNPASWMTYLHPRLDRIICVAEAVRQYFLQMRCLWLRVPPGKLVTVYKGHHPDWYQGPPVDLRTFGIPEGAFVLGCTANYRPRKGIEVLIEATRYFPESLPIHLLLIGRMKVPRVMRRIQASAMRDRIHLTGYRADATAVQAACNAVVLPALRREGLPKVVMEAMACGVPPIVTNAGGSPELVKDGISGIIVKAGDPKAIYGAVMRLSDDPGACHKLGKNARERIIECFHINDTIRRTRDVYEELLGG